MYIVWLLFYAIGRFLFVSILIIVDLLFILFLLLYFRRSDGLIITFLLSRSTRQFWGCNAFRIFYAL